MTANLCPPPPHTSLTPLQIQLCIQLFHGHLMSYDCKQKTCPSFHRGMSYLELGRLMFINTSKQLVARTEIDPPRLTHAPSSGLKLVFYLRPCSPPYLIITTAYIIFSMTLLVGTVLILTLLSFILPSGFVTFYYIKC